jgi:two-component system, chemotaxis family, chemotaxis protein CheY
MAKALVVDDSKTMRTILGKMLVGIGYEVCQAGNGREALEVMDREFPDVSLVLADWNMPEMNGLEFVTELRADRRYASVMVMMVTTETQIEQMTLALEAGANEYVMKPFTKDVILEKLQLLGVVQ